ncbi:FAD-binding oxidoreductase [Streptomyces sp. NPDC001678]|uniref:FAD-binding oxidoreductase n=1 Tax=Streptomyces sp. NPDC001678 TaxID=3364599 RepID=UPI0036B6DEAC
MSGAWERALAGWRAAVGPDQVHTRGPVWQRFNAGTYPGGWNSAAVIRPASVREAARCLRVAERCGVPWQAVSTGRNWGYGGARPQLPDTAVFALDRMAAVQVLDERTGHVRVRPGSTFGALADRLGRAGGRWWPPVVGAGPDVSVLGNVLQDGIAIGPYRRMACHVIEARGLSGDGRPARARCTGPSTARRLREAGLAMVTDLTLRLHPAPAVRQHLLYALPDDVELDDVLAAGTRMLRSGLKTDLDVLSDHRIAAQLGVGAAASGDGPVSRARLATLLPVPLTGRWSAMAGIWGDDRAELAAVRAEVERAWAPFADAAVDGPVEEGYETPDDTGLRTAYWCRPDGMPTRPDPAMDGCGVLWFAPALPPGAPAGRAIEVWEGILRAHRLAPCWALRLDDSRVIAVLALLWDRSVPGADARAVACFHALEEAARGFGVRPYRRPTGLSGGTPSEWERC